MVILDVFMVIREKGVCGPPSSLLGIFFSLGGPVLDHPGRAVVLPVVFSRFVLAVLDHPGWAVVLPGIDSRCGSPVLDHPLPPPEGGELRGARYSMWIVLVRVARFFRGEPIAGTEPVPA